MKRNYNNYLESYSDYLDHFTKAFSLYPTAVNIELTTRCNLKCIMCPKTAGISRTPPDRKISKDLLERLLNELLPYISRIDLVGDGEILLELELVQIVLFHARKYRVLVNASTNGLLLNEEACRILIDGGLHDLNISIDAAHEDTYRTIRGGSFKKLLSNIRLLNKLKSASGSSVPVLHFSMVGMKQNITELPDLVKLAHELDVVSVTLQAMGEFELVKNESIFLRDKKLGRYWYDMALKTGNSLGIEVNLWPNDQFEDDFSIHSSDESDLNSSHKENIRFKDCDFPWDVPYICTDGTVRPCCAMPSLGDLTCNSFQDIWYGTSYNNLRKRMKSPDPPDICRSCPGRGWYSPTQPSSELIIGINDRQLGSGWFETEENSGSHYRWARNKAGYFLYHPNANFLEIEMEAATENGSTKQVTIEIDHSIRHLIELQHGKKENIFLPILGGQVKKLHFIELSGQAWRPCDLNENNEDPRYLTIKFFRSRLFQTSGRCQFANGIFFHGIEISSSVSIQQQHLETTLFFSVEPPNFRMTSDIYYFLHFFRETPFTERKHRITAFFQSCQKRLHFKKRNFFQKDGVLSLRNPFSKIQNVPIRIPLPPDLNHGHYVIFFGLYQKGGHRIPIQNSLTKSFRNSIFLNQIFLSS